MHLREEKNWEESLPEEVERRTQKNERNPQIRGITNI
jgi:hypothetical protein